MSDSPVQGQRYELLERSLAEWKRLRGVLMEIEDAPDLAAAHSLARGGLEASLPEGGKKGTFERYETLLAERRVLELTAEEIDAVVAEIIGELRSDIKHGRACDRSLRKLRAVRALEGDGRG